MNRTENRADSRADFRRNSAPSRTHGLGWRRGWVLQFLCSFLFALDVPSLFAQGDGPDFTRPTAVAAESSGDTAGSLVVIDGKSLIRVDPRSGDRTILSGLDPEELDLVGEGPELRTPTAIAVEPAGETAGQLVIAGNRVLRVDPASGDRTVVSNRTGINAIAVETSGRTAGQLVGVQTDWENLVRLDPQTGEISILSGFDPDQERVVGDGPGLDPTSGFNNDLGYDTSEWRTVAIAVETAGETAGQLVVVEHSLNQAAAPSVLLRVDPETGDRAILSGYARELIGEGTDFDKPVAIAVEASGNLVVVNQSNGRRPAFLLRVNPSTGNRTLLSGEVRGGETAGEGPEFDEPVAVAVETTGETAGHLVVVNRGSKRLLSVDPMTGDRTALSSATASLPIFLRGDCNGDRRLNLADPIFHLLFNFVGNVELICRAACDANGDAELGGSSDALYLLNFLFRGGPAPPTPFPRCGRSSDAADATLGCEIERLCP